MENIITLRKQSDKDDIQCADGELAGYDFLFEKEGDTDSPGSPGSPGSTGSSDSVPDIVLELKEGALMPEGASFVASHKLPGAEGRVNIIVMLSDGSLAYNSDSLPGVSPLVLNPYPSWEKFSPGPLVGLRKVVSSALWLVALTDSALFFAVWNGSGYSWLGETPAPPSELFEMKPRALPPYSATDGELPRFTVTVTANGDVNKAVQSALDSFMSAVAKAGLHIEPVKAAASWRLHDGTLWLRGETQSIGPSAAPSLRTVSTVTRDGISYITMEVTVAPFEVVPAAPGLGVPSGWEEVIAGVEARLFDSEGSLPEVSGSMVAEGVPSDIFAVGGCLLGTSPLLVSRQGLPPVADSSLGGVENLLYVTDSLKAASAAAPGRRPLFLFCSDGIREAVSGASGYRDARLLSRHAPLSAAGCAPLPDGTAFITEAGVMKLSGSTVSPLPSLPSGFSPDTSTKLLYHYGADALILYRPGTTAGLCYLFATKKWHRLLVAAPLYSHHYAWPEIFIHTGSQVGAASMALQNSSHYPAGGEVTPTAYTSDSGPVPFKTRPIKLGSPFKTKQLSEIEGVWPDGSRLPVKVYGALRLGKWYHLGTAPSGHMRMRGSGWRFLRIESFAIKSDTRYLLPHFFIKFAT